MHEMMMAGEETAAPERKSDSYEATETTSLFAPKEAVGGKEFEIGDRVTFTVKDKDTDTGELELTLGESESVPERSGLNSAIDAMPEDE
jgi:hypothetical protein